jgi:hypothetical protein
VRAGLLVAVTDLLGDGEGGPVVVGGDRVVARRFRDLAEAVESGRFAALVADLAVEGQSSLVVGARLIVPTEPAVGRAEPLEQLLMVGLLVRSSVPSGGWPMQQPRYSKH